MKPIYKDLWDRESGNCCGHYFGKRNMSLSVGNEKSAFWVFSGVCALRYFDRRQLHQQHLLPWSVDVATYSQSVGSKFVLYHNYA